MKKILFSFLVVTAAAALTAIPPACTRSAEPEGAPIEQSGPFTPDWESLEKYDEAPEWFLDAKFGLYAHWGVYSVPAFGSEWYPRNMHIRDRKEHRHHLDTYGDPAEFGYHDFVPMFTADNFDAEEWAALFEQAGARFAGPVAEHHDGFSMWGSRVNPWNAAARGPNRDIVGELEKAVRARGMRFMTSFHHSFNNQFPIEKFPTGYYPHVEGWPTGSDDPELRTLYGHLPREEFLEMWKSKLFEVIDAYQPDLIWFDFVLGDIPEDTRRDFLAYCFNRAHERDQEVVVTYKQEDLPREVGVQDFEKGRLDRLTEYPWLTDDTISWGSWCHTENLEIKSAATVLHTLIDIVSKNGVLLLNVSPMADGTIPEDQKAVLREIGRWLDVNGEAVYATRPWEAFGEGPTRLKKGGSFVGRLDYTAKDIRYTRNRDGTSLYLFVLGRPEGDIVPRTLRVTGSEGAEIRILGGLNPVDYRVDENQFLTIRTGGLETGPDISPVAVVFKLTGFELEKR